MTIHDFARILSDEFDRDAWGDIDPYLFKHVADSEEDPSLLDSDEYDHADETVSIIEVLQRVVERVKSALDVAE